MGCLRVWVISSVVNCPIIVSMSITWLPVHCCQLQSCPHNQLSPAIRYPLCLSQCMVNAHKRSSRALQTLDFNVCALCPGCCPLGVQVGS